MDTNSQNHNPHQTPPVGLKPENHDKTGMAVLAYLGILIVIPFLSGVHNDPFIKFHLKQGLILLIGEVIASAIVVIPVFGWIFAPLIWIASAILIIIGIMNVVHHQTKELPVVGHLSKHFNF